MIKAECLYSIETKNSSGEDSHVGCVGVNLESKSHDQLYATEKEVVWYEGLNPQSRTIKKVFSTETPVLQTFWCKFREETSGNKGGGEGSCGAVCIVEQRCLGVHMDTGAIHYVPFPFPVKKVWPLDYGVLVERLVPADIGYDGFPTLFSLLHPVDDFSPVTSRRASTTAASVTVLGFFGEAGLQVRDVCLLEREGLSLPLVVTYNTATNQHNVWSVHLASREDIPTHLATPMKSHSNTLTPFKPLSTSDPSCYGTEATPSGHPTAPPTAPLGLMATPAEMIMGSCCKIGKPGSNILRQPKGFMSGMRIASDIKAYRSPFIGRLRTPNADSAKCFKKFSKSLSPPTLARMSPFSQTVDSRTWSTFYSEELSFGSHYEPLIPQVCLHSLWSGSAGCSDDRKASPSEGASSIFHTVDHMDGHFVGLVIPGMHQIHMLSCEDVEGEKKALSLGENGMDLPGTQVVAVNRIAMMVVFEAEKKELMVYSGIVKLGVVGLCTFPSSVPVGVSNALEDTFSVMVDSPAGDAFRCCLSPLSRHPTIELCLRSICQLLPHETGWSFLSSFYLTSSHLPFSKLLPHFTTWMLASLGLTEESMETDCVSEHAQKICPETLRHEEVVLALHLVYEELKLNVLRSDDLRELSQLLSRVTMLLGWDVYADHYKRDFPHLFHLTEKPSSFPSAVVSRKENITDSEITLPSAPPHIFKWLLLKLQGMQPPPYPVLLDVTRTTALLIKLYSILTCGEEEYLDPRTVMTLLGQRQPTLCWDNYTRSGLPPEHQVILCCIDEGITAPDLDRLPVGVALPVLDCIRRCHESPPSTWSAAAYDLIGRTDIAKTLESAADHATPPLKMRGDGGGDGMNLDLEVLRICFPHDLRVNEVRRMLQSAQPVRVKVVQRPEVSDHDFIQLQEVHLLSLSQRTMGLSVGRGMFTLSTVHPLPTSPLSSFIPPLNLNGRAAPRDATVGLEHVEKPVDMTMWPDFHNGVAAGLCLAKSSSKLDSAWIVFNRPSEEDVANTYAGFLMALGLTGHLDSLQDYDLYGYLQDKHELTVVALLLGIAASNCGKMSRSLLGMLSIFFPPLLPPGAADMEISHTMQTAALIGIGLLYQGSGNRHMVQVVLNEISRPPGPELEFAENRESYSLAAGLALGLITLGGGQSLDGLADLNLVDQLLLLINGGWKRETSARMDAGVSHLVMEGEMVNTHVTAPGAIVALGLLFLKTNDRTVAAMLDPPDTLYKLDCVRPDFLLLRAVSRGLILWDSIEASREWIHQQIPAIIREWSEDKVGAHSGVDVETLSQGRAYITTGCCFAIGLRFAGSHNEKAQQYLLEVVKDFVKKVKSPLEEAAGKHCLEQCLCATLLALAMVMSGSGDLQVMRVIRRLHVWMGELTYGSHMAIHMALGLLFLGGGRYTLSTSNVAIASLVCAFFPVFPSNSLDNRYHLQALRHLYVLAARPGVLIARDREAGHACPVRVVIRSEERQTIATTPCLLQNWDKIESLEVVDEKYWPFTVGAASDGNNPLRTAVSKFGVMYVQPYSSGRRSEGKGVEQFGCVRGKVPSKCLSVSPLSSYLTDQSNLGSKFVAAALVECLEQEKLVLVFDRYLQLEQSAHQMTKHTTDPCLPQHLWQLKLARGYISLYFNLPDGPGLPWNGCGQPLLSQEYIGALESKVWRFLCQAEERCIGPLKSYLKLHPQEVSVYSSEEVCLLAKLLVWHDIPYFKWSSEAMLPDVFLQLKALIGPAAAVVAVKLLPLFPSNTRLGEQ